MSNSMWIQRPPWISFFISSINTAPADGDETNTTAQNTVLNVSSPGLLANATDLDADTLRVSQFVVNGVTTTITAGSSNNYAIPDVGAIYINANGAYSFNPVAAFTGAVQTITYTVVDDQGGSDTSTLSLTVTSGAPADVTKTIAVTDLEGLYRVLDDFPTSTQIVSLAFASQTVQSAADIVRDGYTYTPTTGIAGANVAVEIDRTGHLRIVPNWQYTGTVSNVVVTVADAAGQNTKTANYTLAITAPTYQMYRNVLGAGNDANGRPILSLHASAQKIYVDPLHSAANDANAGTDPNLPLVNAYTGWKKLRAGYGDWLMIAQRTPPQANGLGDPGFFFKMVGKAGLSQAYPTVVTTYDHTAVSNSALYGKSVVQFGTTDSGDPNWHPMHLHTALDDGTRYLFIEGIGLNLPDDGEDRAITVLATNEWSGDATADWIFYNCEFDRIQLSFDGHAGHFVRNVSIRNSLLKYSANQGTYGWYNEGCELAGNVLYHNGWWGDTRTVSNPLLEGEPNIRDHNAYLGTKTHNYNNSGNTSIRPSATGTQQRGGGWTRGNAYLECPLGLAIGLGDNYDLVSRMGVASSVDLNVFVETSEVDPGNPRGIGVYLGNTRYCKLKNTLIFGAGAHGLVSPNTSPLQVFANFDQDSNVDVENFIAYDWRHPIYTPDLTVEVGRGAYGSTRNHVAFTGAVIPNWANPTAGNSNAPATAYPHPERNIDTFATAKGYADRTALYTAMQADHIRDWATEFGDYMREAAGVEAWRDDYVATPTTWYEPDALTVFDATADADVAQITRTIGQNINRDGSVSPVASSAGWQYTANTAYYYRDIPATTVSVVGKAYLYMECLSVDQLGTFDVISRAGAGQPNRIGLRRFGNPVQAQIGGSSGHILQISTGTGLPTGMHVFWVMRFANGDVVGGVDQTAVAIVPAASVTGSLPTQLSDAYELLNTSSKTTLYKGHQLVIRDAITLAEAKAMVQKMQTKFGVA